MTTPGSRPCLASLALCTSAMIALSLQLSSLLGDLAIAVIVSGVVTVSALGVTHGFATRRGTRRSSN